MMDRYLTCGACEWSGHHSAADRAGLDRACPECGGSLALQQGDRDA
jgi:ribosomal protein S27AE